MGRYCAVCGVWEHIGCVMCVCVVYVVCGRRGEWRSRGLGVLSSQYPAMGYGLGVVCSCVIAITDDILYEIPTWNICTVVIAVILV